MKICCIASSLFSASEDSYGSESMTMHLADALGDLGHEVILFAAPQTPEGNYKLMLMPSSHSRVSYEAESFCYDEYRDLLLGSNYIIDQSATCITCEQIFWWDRDWLENNVGVWVRNGTEFFHPRSPVSSKLHGVAVSKVAKKIAIEKWNLPEELVHVIWHGIDEKKYSFNSDREDYLAYVGRPHPDKGIETIIRLASRLPNETFKLGWRAHTDEHKKFDRYFRDKADNLENIIFCEFSEKNQFRDKLNLYQKAKAFIQPTDRNYIEAFGLTQIEALSTGCPVITADHGSHPELITEKLGFLCSNLEDYRRAIENVDSIDPHDCREHVLQNWTKNQMARRYLELYRELKSTKDDILGLNPTISLEEGVRRTARWYKDEYQLHPRFEFQRKYCEGSVLNVGSKEDPAKLKRDYGATNLDRNEWPGVDVVADARFLPFPDKSYDTVVLGDVLEHVKEFELVLEEARRVARKNVVVTVPTKEYEERIGHRGENYPFSEHVNNFTVEQLQGLFPNATLFKYVETKFYIGALIWERISE